MMWAISISLAHALIVSPTGCKTPNERLTANLNAWQIPFPFKM